MKHFYLCIMLFHIWSAVVTSFRLPLKSNVGKRVASFTMPAKITDNVEFDTIAREWRLKWSDDDNKASLTSVQQLLQKFSPTLGKVEGLKKVQRIVCGGCHDYKVVVSLTSDKFSEWESTKFHPETDFLDLVKKIPGVSLVETQTYTIMPVEIE